MKRTSLKRGNKGLAKVSKKKMEERHMKEEQDLCANDNEVWKFLYLHYISIPPGERKCQSCGRNLASEPRSYYFDHLIEKSKRPDLAMEKDNIFLCCLTCHSLKTDGHPTDPHREAIEKAKERFGIS